MDAQLLRRYCGSEARASGVERPARRFREHVILPILMLIAYIGLMLWFRARGGYRPVEFGPGTEG